MDRRTFVMLLAGSIEAPRLSWGKGATTGRTMFYASVGGDLTHYSTDVDDASLVKRNTVTLPANIQYAWPHPSKQYLYIVSSGGGPGIASNQNFAHAFRIDPTTGVMPTPNTSACAESMTINLATPGTMAPANATGAAATPGVSPASPAGC